MHSVIQLTMTLGLKRYETCIIILCLTEKSLPSLYYWSVPCNLSTDVKYFLQLCTIVNNVVCVSLYFAGVTIGAVTVAICGGKSIRVFTL